MAPDDVFDLVVDSFGHHAAEGVDFSVGVSDLQALMDPVRVHFDLEGVARKWFFVASEFYGGDFLAYRPENLVDLKLVLFSLTLHLLAVLEMLSLGLLGQE